MLFSNEVATRTLLDLNEDQEQSPEEYRVLDGLRLRIVPVLGTMPSLFGMALAANVLCQLANQPLK
jgi:tRNA threonylcarbamoyladenosine dehydratase